MARRSASGLPAVHLDVEALRSLVMSRSVCLN